MASNLSSVGFYFSSAEEFQEAMIKLAVDCSERVSCEAGDYSIWRSRTGAEIWFHLPMLGTEDDVRDIAGLTPFYEGLGVVSLEIVERVNRPEDNPFEGAFTAQVKDPDGTNEGYPLTFDAVDFSAHAARELPFTAAARLVCFAREVRAFADEEAYQADRSGPLGEIALSPQAFIPLGQFAEPEDCERGGPESTALLTGRVRECRLQTNEVTGRPFHWLLVDSMAASFDVVADPEIIEGEIKEGGTVQVTGIMIGRLVEG